MAISQRGKDKNLRILLYFGNLLECMVLIWQFLERPLLNHHYKSEQTAFDKPNIWTSLLLDLNMGWGVCNCSIFNNFFTIGGNQLNASLLIEGFSSIQRAWQDFPWVLEISTWQPNKLSYFIDRHESSTLDKHMR